MEKMKNINLRLILMSSIGFCLLFWTLSCKKNSVEVSSIGPKEWFEAYAESDSAALSWRLNHVKNINWEKAVKVKDAFDNEAWEVPMESTMYFGYEHTVTNVYGQEAPLANQLKSTRVIYPFQVHLLITKNKAGKLDGRILNYFAPGFDSTQNYPNNLNELQESRDFGIHISEFSGRPYYSLYYGVHGLNAFTAPSFELSEVLKSKVPVAEKADSCSFYSTNVNTAWYQHNAGGDNSTGWLYINSTSQFHTGYICSNRVN